MGQGIFWRISLYPPASSGAFFHASHGDAPPLACVVLRPNRSLPRSGLAWLLVIVWGLLLVPLLPLVGTMALWAMLPFLLAVPVALWYFIERNYKDGTLTERLCLWPDLITVRRQDPRRDPLDWQANPYWVTVNMVAKGGPVDNYLTLKGGPREIELGAFLAPEERLRLRRDLEDALKRAKTPPPATT